MAVGEEIEVTYLGGGSTHTFTTKLFGRVITVKDDQLVGSSILESGKSFVLRRDRQAAYTVSFA